MGQKTLRIRVFLAARIGLRCGVADENDNLIWTCDCGKVRFEIAPIRGTRCVCYCRDCQAFQAHLDRLDCLEPAGGSDLFQAMPHEVRLLDGSEQLAALRLTDKGPLRWYTTCCNTGICNTGARRAVPLASFLVRGFNAPDRAGPVVARVNRKGATGQIEGPDGSIGSLIRRFLGRALLALLTGRYRRTPFFTPEGDPIAAPYRLSTDETRKAYGG